MNHPFGILEGTVLLALLSRLRSDVLWSKQLYHYVVRDWENGDPAFLAPPAERAKPRLDHLYNADVISMPNKWEYPWYPAWDMAFHCLSLRWSIPNSRRSSSCS